MCQNLSSGDRDNNDDMNISSTRHHNEVAWSLFLAKCKQTLLTVNDKIKTVHNSVQQNLSSVAPVTSDHLLCTDSFPMFRSLFNGNVPEMSGDHFELFYINNV